MSQNTSSKKLQLIEDENLRDLDPSIFEWISNTSIPLPFFENLVQSKISSDKFCEDYFSREVMKDDFNRYIFENLGNIQYEIGLVRGNGFCIINAFLSHLDFRKTFSNVDEIKAIAEKLYNDSIDFYNNFKKSWMPELSLSSNVLPFEILELSSSLYNVIFIIIQKDGDEIPFIVDLTNNFSDKDYCFILIKDAHAFSILMNSNDRKKVYENIILSKKFKKLEILCTEITNF